MTGIEAVYRICIVLALAAITAGAVWLKKVLKRYSFAERRSPDA